MLSNPFDESIQGYGYEDLLLAKALKEKGVEILHIDNPVQHLGLETSKVFLKKTTNAIDNLIQLRHTGKGIATRLETFAGKLERWGIDKYFIKYYKHREAAIEANLLSPKPRIRNLDAFKLYCYYRIQKARENKNQDFSQE